MAAKVPFRRGFRGCESTFGTRVPLRSTGASVSQLRNALRSGKAWFRTKSPIPQGISQLRRRFWHMSAISQHSDLISQLRNGCEVPKREKSQFHSRTPISAIVEHISITSRSSNYACNISLESLGSQKSIDSNGARFSFETEKLWPFEDDCANYERKCRTSILLLFDTFLKHFLDLKLCIPYLVSKLGKSGVQRFKWYVIRRWNEEVMVVWRQARKAEREFRSRDAIWKGISQLRNHFWHTSAILQHSSPHFEAAIHLRNHFWAAKWAAKSLLSFEMAMKWSLSFDMAAKSPMSCEITFKLRNGLREFPSSTKSTSCCENAPSFRNELRNCPLPVKWSPNFEMAAKSPPSLELAFKLWNWLAKWRKVCKNTLQSQGKLLKCQQSPATMHLKRRAPHTLGSHTLSLSLHF